MTLHYFGLLMPKDDCAETSNYSNGYELLASTRNPYLCRNAAMYIPAGILLKVLNNE